MDNRITTITLRDLLRSLGDLLMPRVCAVCGRQLLAQERHLCLVCEAGLPLTHFERLSHNAMADAFNAQIDSPRYEHATALFYYRSDYRKITQALKYGRNFALGRHAARVLGSRLAASPLWSGINLVVPVPLHWTRRWLRGYNQASIIAHEVYLELRRTRLSRHSRPDLESPPLRFEPRLLRRVRRTGTQTRLANEERAVNVSGAFCVRECVARRLRAQIGPDSLSDGSQNPYEILLIDDVATTGATLAACYAALRSAFGPSVRISVATLAFVD